MGSRALHRPISAAVVSDVKKSNVSIYLYMHKALIQIAFNLPSVYITIFLGYQQTRNVTFTVIHPNDAISRYLHLRGLNWFISCIKNRLHNVF